MNLMYNNKFSSPGKHLTLNDRMIIKRMLDLNKSTLEISRVIGKSQRTIQRELKRGKTTIRNYLWEDVEVYSPHVAQDKYNTNIISKGKVPKILRDDKLLNHIIKMYQVYKYSPEAIVANINNQNLSFNTSISSTLIRYYVKNKIINVKYNKKSKTRHCPRISKKIPHNKSIDFRPEYINNREEYGHWEGDLVVGGSNKGKVLLTLVERKTRKSIIRLISSKEQKNIINEIDKLERMCGSEFKKHFKTITFDNGSEFLDYKSIELSKLTKEKRLTVYYTHPYCSYERGSNENMHKLIRKFIPKSKTFDNTTDRYIKYIEDWINNYPRKILGYKSANMIQFM